MNNEKANMANRIAAVIALVIFVGIWGGEAIYDGWYGAGIGWFLGLVMAALGFVIAWLALSGLAWLGQTALGRRGS